MTVSTFIIMTILSGFFGTLSMTIFLWTITALKIANVNLVTSIGSHITGSEEDALIPGLFIHFTSGLFFALLYCIIFEITPRADFYSASYTFIGFFLGLIHGVIFSLILIVSLVRNHPLKRYRNSGFSVVIFYFLGHIIYGLGVGFVFSLGEQFIF